MRTKAAWPSLLKVGDVYLLYLCTCVTAFVHKHVLRKGRSSLGLRGVRDQRPRQAPHALQAIQTQGPPSALVCYLKLCIATLS